MKKLILGLPFLLLTSALAQLTPLQKPDEVIRGFLWSKSADQTKPTTLIYHDIGDNYNTNITFAADGTFQRSDNNKGLWHIEESKLILDSVDSIAYTITFMASSIENGELRGRIAKGTYRNHKILLKQVPAAPGAPVAKP